MIEWAGFCLGFLIGRCGLAYVQGYIEGRRKR